MSHFTVLVVGDNVEEQLAPFQENNMGDCPTEYMEFSDETEEVENDFKERDEKYKDNTIEEFAKEYHGYEKNEDGKFGYMQNPDSRWDWYVVGGRWAGMLKLKEGKEGHLEELDCLGICKSRDDDRKKMQEENIKNRCVDSAKVGDVDFSLDDKEIKAHERFWEIIVEDSPLKEGEEKPFCMSRKEYFTEKYKDKETYARLQSTFYTHAILKDGEWIESGSMGWFGCSSETPEEEKVWEEKYAEFLNKLPKDTMITIVDCHI